VSTPTVLDGAGRPEAQRQPHHQIQHTRRNDMGLVSTRACRLFLFREPLGFRARRDRRQRDARVLDSVRAPLILAGATLLLGIPAHTPDSVRT
jgi:hypothetical protein